VPVRADKSLLDVESLDDLMKQYAALHARILRGQQAQRFVVFIANPEFGYGNKYAPSDRTSLQLMSATNPCDGNGDQDSGPGVHVRVRSHVGAGHPQYELRPCVPLLLL
jgi:hypothetical protein